MELTDAEKKEATDRLVAIVNQYPATGITTGDLSERTGLALVGKPEDEVPAGFNRRNVLTVESDGIRYLCTFALPDTTFSNGDYTYDNCAGVSICLTVRPSITWRALSDAAKEMPTAPPVKIANFAKMKISETKQKRQFKNPAINQLQELRKRFPDARIERVGGADMSTFQVWLEVPANRAPRGQKITVEMTSDQLRTVKGKVNVGANELSATGVKNFLFAWGVK